MSDSLLIFSGVEAQITTLIWIFVFQQKKYVKISHLKEGKQMEVN